MDAANFPRNTWIIKVNCQSAKCLRGFYRHACFRDFFVSSKGKTSGTILFDVHVSYLHNNTVKYGTYFSELSAQANILHFLTVSIRTVLRYFTIFEVIFLSDVQNYFSLNRLQYNTFLSQKNTEEEKINRSTIDKQLWNKISLCY